MPAVELGDGRWADVFAGMGSTRTVFRGEVRTFDVCSGNHVADGGVELACCGDCLEAGDYFSLSMYCVDENTYNYFRELAQQQNTGSFVAVLFTDVAPANPNNNLSGGVLGYFSANTTQTWSGYVNL